jgi:hypothetical protein
LVSFVVCAFRAVMLHKAIRVENKNFFIMLHF